MKRKIIFIVLTIAGLIIIGSLVYLGIQYISFQKQLKEQQKTVSVEGKILFRSDRSKETPLFLLDKGKIKLVKVSSDKFSDYNELQKKGLSRIIIRDKYGNPYKETIIPEDYNPFDFDISPDGQTIVFSSRMNNDTYNLYTIDINGENLKQITFFPREFPRKVNSASHPRFSPNGKTIVFQAKRPLKNSAWPEGYYLYTVNSDGTNLKELFNDEKLGMQPNWSPDGKEIVFICFFEIDGEGVRNVCITDINGENVRRITKHKYYDANPCFSPDGKKIAYASNKREYSSYGMNLFAINIDGTNEIRLTPAQPLKRYPYWATDDYPDWHK